MTDTPYQYIINHHTYIKMFQYGIPLPDEIASTQEGLIFTFNTKREYDNYTIMLKGFVNKMKSENSVNPMRHRPSKITSFMELIQVLASD